MRKIDSNSNIEIYITDTQDELNSLSSKMKDIIVSKNVSVLGIDTEFMSDTLCIIQISCKYFSYLFRVAVMRESRCIHYIIPRDLLSILRDTSIVKAGIGLTNDIYILQQYSIHINQLLDLQSIGIILGKGILSAEKMCKEFLHNLEPNTLLSLGYKSKCDHMVTDWRDPTDEALLYAINDSMIVIDILDSIFSRINVIDNSMCNNTICNTSETAPTHTPQIHNSKDEMISLFTTSNEIYAFYNWLKPNILDIKKTERVRNYSINAYSKWAKNVEKSLRYKIFDTVIDILAKDKKVVITSDYISLPDTQIQ